MVKCWNVTVLKQRSSFPLKLKLSRDKEENSESKQSEIDFLFFLYTLACFVCHAAPFER